MRPQLSPTLWRLGDPLFSSFFIKKKFKLAYPYFWFSWSLSLTRWFHCTTIAFCKFSLSGFFVHSYDWKWRLFFLYTLSLKGFHTYNNKKRVQNPKMLAFRDSFEIHVHIPSDTLIKVPQNSSQIYSLILYERAFKHILVDAINSFKLTFIILFSRVPTEEGMHHTLGTSETILRKKFWASLNLSGFFISPRPMFRNITNTLPKNFQDFVWSQITYFANVLRSVDNKMGLWCNRVFLPL